METPKQRLLQYIEYLGISKSQFYKKTGLSNGYLDKNPNVNSSKIEIIGAAFPALNLNWVISGEGPMIRQEPPEDMLGLDDTYTGRELFEASRQAIKETVADMIMTGQLFLPDAVQTRDALIEQLKKENASLAARIKELEKK